MLLVKKAGNTISGKTDLKKKASVNNEVSLYCAIRLRLPRIYKIKYMNAPYKIVFKCIRQIKHNLIGKFTIIVGDRNMLHQSFYMKYGNCEQHSKLEQL